MMKKLGFGLMRLPITDPTDAASVDLDQLKQMVDLFIERGFTYFDTAWMYNDFASESAVKETLVDRHPRDSFTLATKLHFAFFDTPADRERIFSEQLRKTGAGYFDYYLLHGVDATNIGKFESNGCFEWLQGKKDEGLVRHIGFSFHDTAEVLDGILARHPEAEFVQLQVNYLDWESDWIQSRANLEVCARHNKPVIVMEPVKGGTLARVPEPAEALLKAADPQASVPSWAIRFAASQPGVMVVLSGMSDLAQLDDNTSFMADFQPLTADEQALCFKTADIVNAQIAVPCTGCAYCTDGCPQNIAIPQYFSLYNELMREDMERKGWTVSFASYNALAAKFGKASECVGCHACEQACPQHLPIVEYLEDVAARFEN